MKFAFVLCVLCTACMLEAANVRYEAGADKAVQFAAKDLARCLSEISGEKYDVLAGGAPVKLGRKQGRAWLRWGKSKLSVPVFFVRAQNVLWENFRSRPKVRAGRQIRGKRRRIC